MSCAAALTAAAPAREVRKTVTVLFCDLVGSTALGERTDPEALRALLGRYFERMSGIVESHGGTVEKFIGDAVMAVFGVPLVHEDDALRACRAAVEMRDALPELGIEGRIGVNTGEVVTGTAERLVTGDAVNVAARFEQAAAPGEVLIGEATHELVQGAVDAEPVEPLVLKGKSEPVPAFRLLAAHAAPERRHDSLFVGRERELGLLSEAWERAVGERRCELVTVVGEPGIGKSRLAAEALAVVGARVVRGRCLPYGAGITYWPVVEVIKQLDVLPADPAAAAALRSLLGESDAGTSAEEIGWAFRKLLEEQAPLVVVFDDIQWGEETFLDLIEHVALLSSGAPLLLLCMARPELLDSRPTWPVTIRLEPLDAPTTADALIGADVPEELRARIAAAAAGNPLFISEMLAMTQETGSEVEVPASLKALLAARLDQLDPAERRVLECGSVEGEVFHRGAVQALTPEEAQVTPRLAALVRRELIRSDRPQFAGEDGFRFRHLLIRDTAYDALPKTTRAELHQRFAAWLEQHGRAGRAGRDRRLPPRTGGPLPRRARHDPTPHSRSAPGIASWLPGSARARPGGCTSRGRLARTRAEHDAAVQARRPRRTRPGRSAPAGARARRTGRRRGGRACTRRRERDRRGGRPRDGGFTTGLMVVPGPPDELETLLLDARRRLEVAGDHAGLVHVWGALGFGVANMRGRYDDWAAASQQARHHSLLDGRTGGPEFGIALVAGSHPADEALEAIDRLLVERPSAWLRLSRAWLLGMLDRGDEARRTANDAATRLREQSGALWGEWILAELATLAGDHEDASTRLRALCEWLEAMGQSVFLDVYLAALGRSLCWLGRFDEAELLAIRVRSLAEESGGVSDPYTPWQLVLGRVQAHRGELAEAERLAREGVAVIEQTDSLGEQASALWDLAEVLATAGRTDDAEAALEKALDLCRRKKNLALAKQVGDRLAQLRGEPLRA